MRPPFSLGGLICAANERETDDGASDPRDLAARIVTSMSHCGIDFAFNTLGNFVCQGRSGGQPALMISKNEIF
jgi:hypothetical protein